MFIPRITKSFSIQGAVAAWQDTDMVAVAGEVFRRRWDEVSQLYIAQPPGAGTVISPVGGASATNGNAYLCANVQDLRAAFVVRADGSGAPGFGTTGGMSYQPVGNAPDETVLASGGRLFACCNDYQFGDNSGAWNFTLVVGSYVYASIQQGTTASIAVEGDYVRGSGGWNGGSSGSGGSIPDFTWIVDNAGYAVQGRSGAANGWNVTLSSNRSQMTITVPPEATVGQFYAAYVADPATPGSYRYTVFHVTPAPLLPPIITATARLVGNVPSNRLVIS